MSTYGIVQGRLSTVEDDRGCRRLPTSRTSRKGCRRHTSKGKMMRSSLWDAWSRIQSSDENTSSL